MFVVSAFGLVFPLLRILFGSSSSQTPVLSFKLLRILKSSHKYPFFFSHSAEDNCLRIKTFDSPNFNTCYMTFSKSLTSIELTHTLFDTSCMTFVVFCVPLCVHITLDL